MIRCFLLFAGLCIILSCEKPDLSGSDVLPVTDQPGVFFTDTFGISVRSVAEDSLVGSNSLSPFFLGSMNDPEIGISNASFYTQIRLGSSLSGFNGVTTADSVILSLGYHSIYGDSNSVHHISVNEIDENMSADSIYFTTRDFALKANGALGYFSLVPDLVDSIPIGIAKQAPQLRLKLNDDFGNRILQQYITDAATFSSNTNFLAYFKGINITDSVDGNGSILTLDPNSPLNSITLYYKRLPADTFSSSYSFLINSNSARNNRFKHQYNTTVFDSVSPATTYVQSMAGLKTKIQFPNLMNLVANHAVSVNKAEVVVSLKDLSNTTLANHTSLLVYAPDSLGRNTLIADAFELNGFIGGVFSGGQYKFNISRHVQRILNGKVNNYGIYLVAAGSVSNAQRTLLQGTGKITLNLTYTLQNN